MIEKVIHNPTTPYVLWSFLETPQDIEEYLYQRILEGYKVNDALAQNLNYCLPVWVGRVSTELLGVKMEIITKERLKSEIKQLIERLS